MWAVLIVGIASGLSFLCCALFFLLCFGAGESMRNCFQMCCHSEDHKNSGTTYKKSTLIRKISGLGKKGKREGGRLYGIQVSHKSGRDTDIHFRNVHSVTTGFLKQTS